jgi:hypothetical protein
MSNVIPLIQLRRFYVDKIADYGNILPFPLKMALQQVEYIILSVGTLRDTANTNSTATAILQVTS